MDKPTINLDDLKLDCAPEDRRAAALGAKELIEANQRLEHARLTNNFQIPSTTRFILLKDVASKFSRETSDVFFGGTFYNSLQDAATKCEFAAYNPITGDRVLTPIEN